MSELDFHHNFNLFFDGLELPRENKDRTEQMSLHAKRGKGMIQRFVPRFDIDVVVSDFTFCQDYSLPLFTRTAMIELNYCLQGKREISVAGTQYEFVPGTCTLQFMNEVGVRFEFSRNNNSASVLEGVSLRAFGHAGQE